MTLLASSTWLQGMELGAVHGHGRRGFHTFAPPPQGCLGWGKTAQNQSGLDAAEKGTRGLHKLKSFPVIKARDEGSLNTMVGLVPPDAAKTGAPLIAGRASTKLFSSDPARSASVMTSHQTTMEDSAVETSLGSNSTALLAEAQLAREVNPSHLGPLKGTHHLRAVRTGDLNQLQSLDSAFKEAMEEDSTLETALGQDAALAGALGVYRSALGALDPAPEHKRCAFQAVMRDDAELLRALFDSGSVPWDAKNGGGQTLLDVAMERKKSRCQFAIQRARDRQDPPRICQSGARPNTDRSLTPLSSRHFSGALEQDDEGRPLSGGDGWSSHLDGRASQLSTARSFQL